MKKSILGIVGGSGLYDIEGLTNKKWRKVSSPFGEPSDSLLFSEFDGVSTVFLPRHRRGHIIPPSEINYRANIDALKRSGVTDIISIGAVGSFKEELSPGTFVIVDQFIDQTFAREKTFFSKGCVAHVSMAHPVCCRLGDHIENSVEEKKIPYKRGGIYLAMEGPQFSSMAESHNYQRMNCDVVGMTNMPEAKLAREAEICYASVAMVTDYDCWHPDHDNVEVEHIIQVLLTNAEKAKGLVKSLIPRIKNDKNHNQCSCRKALEHAIITAPSERNPEVVKHLDAIAGRVLNKPNQ